MLHSCPCSYRTFLSSENGTLKGPLPWVKLKDYKKPSCFRLSDLHTVGLMAASVVFHVVVSHPKKSLKARQVSRDLFDLHRTSHPTSCLHVHRTNQTYLLTHDCILQRPEWGHGGSAISAMKETIILAACGAEEILPQNADLPADVFTACLTTPIKIALTWLGLLRFHIT